MPILPFVAMCITNIVNIGVSNGNKQTKSNIPMSLSPGAVRLFFPSRACCIVKAKRGEEGNLGLALVSGVIIGAELQ